MALQEIAGGVWSAAPSLISGVVNGFALNATGKRVALIVRIEKAGTLEAVEFKPGTDLAINAASEIRVAFQNVNATGEPDGTDDQFRDMLGSSLSSALWKDSGIISSDGTDTGTKRTVARGDVLAIVFDYDVFTAADVFSVRQMSPASSGLPPEAMPLPQAPYSATFDASWTIGGRNPLSIGLRYSDGTFAYLGAGVVPIDLTTSLSINEGFLANDEVGVRFRLTVEATLRSLWALLDRSVSGGVDWQIRVYDDADVLLGQSVTLPAAAWGSGTSSIIGAYRLFTTDVQIEANRFYRATIRALSGATASVFIVLVRHQVNAIAQFDAHDGGRDYYSTRRTNNGLWTDELTVHPMISLHFSHFADSSAGGGGSGSGAPGRGFFRGGVS